jgi:cytochrome b561
MRADLFFRLIILLFLSLVMLILSGTAFMLIEGIGYDVLNLHKTMGISLLILLPIHIYLRKDKFKKMILDFLSETILQRENSSCDHGKLLKTLKNRPLNQICEMLHIDFDSTLAMLRMKQIIVENMDQKLEEIAIINSHESLKILGMILEQHIRGLNETHIKN